MQFFVSSRIDNDLLIQIRVTRSKIKTVKNQFEFETDPKLINSYIYELKALEERYSYYLSQCKNNVENICTR
ncbi:MAG: DUF2508 family protein [Clostridia bacterium]